MQALTFVNQRVYFPAKLDWQRNFVSTELGCNSKILKDLSVRLECHARFSSS